MNPKTYSTSEVAAKIGVARQTLYNWIESGLFDAPELIVAGNASVRLWTDEHLRAAREIKGTLRPGPKRARLKTKGKWAKKGGRQRKGGGR